jgi:hypothetical protein
VANRSGPHTTPGEKTAGHPTVVAYSGDKKYAKV